MVSWNMMDALYTCRLQSSLIYIQGLAIDSPLSCPLSHSVHWNAWCIRDEAAARSSSLMREWAHALGRLVVYRFLSFHLGLLFACCNWYAQERFQLNTDVILWPLHASSPTVRKDRREAAGKHFGGFVTVGTCSLSLLKHGSVFILNL